MKVKETEKLNIQKTKIMASGPVTSWQIDGETVADFIFGGFKITADDDCSHEIKRHLLLGRKIMINLDSILKSRGTRDQIANICWIIKKQESSRKTSTFALLTLPNPLTV